MVSRLTVKDIVKTSLPVLLGVLFFSIITGSRLENEMNTLTNIHPVLLLVLPAFINITGDLASVFCSRLTSAIFTGKISSRFRPFHIYLTNLFGIMAVSLTAFTFVSILGNFLTDFIFHTPSPLLPTMITIILSGLSATFIMIIISSVIILVTYRKGWDPDSITPPFNTTGGDMVGTIILLYLTSIFLLT